MFIEHIFIICVMLIFWPTTARVNDQMTEHETVSLHTVESVAGGIAHLPCDIKPSIVGDKLVLVIWFKEDDGTPIYSIDARRKSIEEAFHNANKIFKDRATFRINDSPAKLTLTNISDSDAGVYRCRVDFKRSPTKNNKVNLTVILPPEKLIVLDENGGKIQSHVLGPYNEGSSVNITCISAGGRPLPSVTWWQGNTMLDETFETISRRRVRNVLHLDNLQRQHLFAVYTCQAYNNDQTHPASTAVSIDLNLKPLEIKIQNKYDHLSAGNLYSLSCVVTGSRPEPLITWWKTGTKLLETKGENSSVLQFKPSESDTGKFLTCRGENPLLPDSPIEDFWVLNIYHRPIPVLEIGRNENTSTVIEGDIVYFQCNIKANPWAERVVWKHNGLIIANNLRAGILMNNESLVLHDVNKDHEGTYKCVATNEEGSGESNDVYLDVMYAPVCRSSDPEIIGVSIGETVNVICEVDGNPDILQYSWSFRNTSNREETLIAFDQSVNTLMYTPMSDYDFGSLLCTATNNLGSQRMPCVYILILAEKPESVQNCLVTNETMNAFSVACTEGFNGGLKQEFLIEVYEILSSPDLIKNFTSRVAQFSVTGLRASETFELRIFAINKKGLSEPLHIQGHTLAASQPTSFLPLFDNSDSALFKLDQLIGIFLGCILAFVILSLSVLAMLMIKRKNKRIKQLKGGLRSAAEGDPDIIPHAPGRHKSASGDNDCEGK